MGWLAYCQDNLNNNRTSKKEAKPDTSTERKKKCKIELPFHQINM